MLKFFQKDTRKKNFLFFLFFACSWQHRYCSACKRTSAQDTEDQVCILTPPCQFSLSSPHRHTSPGISRWGIWRALNLSRCGKAHVSRRRQKPCVCCRPAVCRNGTAGFSPYIYSMLNKYCFWRKKKKYFIFFGNSGLAGPVTELRTWILAHVQSWTRKLWFMKDTTMLPKDGIPRPGWPSWKDCYKRSDHEQSGCPSVRRLLDVCGESETPSTPGGGELMFNESLPSFFGSSFSHCIQSSRASS